jgi:hypothetical protein
LSVLVFSTVIFRALHGQGLQAETNLPEITNRYWLVDTNFDWNAATVHD